MRHEPTFVVSVEKTDLNIYAKDAEREAETEFTQSRGRQSARRPFPTGDGCRALSPDDGEKGLFGFRSAHLFLIEVTLNDAVVGDR